MIRVIFLICGLLLAYGVHAEPADAKVADEAAKKTEAKEPPAFDIFEYQVEGNTVLTTKQIEDSVYGFLGEKKTIEDVEYARASLERTFRNAGYLTVFVSIPEQEVNSGVVKLQVTEGRVDRLRVVGSRYYSLGKIKEGVPEFAEGKVPNFPKLQTEMAALNSTPDRKVSPVLRPSKTPGKVEVELKVKDELPFHGSLELNDRYSPNTTRTRLNASLRYTNLWQLDHSLGVSMQLTPQDVNEVKVFSGTYVIPRKGDYWAFYGVLSDSNISAVGDINVLGKGHIVGMRYIHPLPALSNYTHSFTAGVDYKDFKENTLILGSDNLSRPISYMPFYLGYDSTLNGKESVTQLNLSTTLSMRGLGNDPEEFRAKRFNADASFAYVKAGIKHTERFMKGWQLQGRVSGQFTGQPLIGNEQFAAGGVESVRGYLESTALGDRGAYGSLELRTPSFAKHFNKDIADLYAQVFFDVGRTEVVDPQPSQIARFDLRSVGAGIVLRNWKGMTANLDYAKALHDAGVVKNGDDRVHFKLGFDW